MVTGRSSRTTRADLVLDRPLLVVGQRPVEREVEAEVVGCHERTGLAGRLADDVAQRAVEQVRAGVVAHRVRAPLRVDHRLDRFTDAQPAVERAAMDDQAADRPLRVRDGEQRRCRRPARGSPPWSPTCPPPSA